jgi:hypothetical protein
MSLAVPFLAMLVSETEKRRCFIRMDLSASYHTTVQLTFLGVCAPFLLIGSPSTGPVMTTKHDARYSAARKLTILERRISYEVRGEQK